VLLGIDLWGNARFKLGPSGGAFAPSFGGSILFIMGPALRDLAGRAKGLVPVPLGARLRPGTELFVTQRTD